MIEVEDLVKKFGSFAAVDRISFEIERGTVLGFLGPNGAGKSTTMKVICGFLAPTSGTVKVCGHDIETHPQTVKQSIGYLPEGSPSYNEMTPNKYLRFIARIRGYSASEQRWRVATAVGKMGLQEVLHTPIETLSKGFKRRVGLAQAILHDPPALILDEPTDGLDPNQKHQVRTLIKTIAKEKAIIISTHILEEVEAVCTKAIILNKGRIISHGSPIRLAGKSTGNWKFGEFEATPGRLDGLFRHLTIDPLEPLTPS